MLVERFYETDFSLLVDLLLAGLEAAGTVLPLALIEDFLCVESAECFLFYLEHSVEVFDGLAFSLEQLLLRVLDVDDLRLRD